MTLKCWVKDLLPISVMKVVDANLLSREDRHSAKQQCVSFVFNLAMECTIESLELRINAKEIVSTWGEHYLIRFDSGKIETDQFQKKIELI